MAEANAAPCAVLRILCPIEQSHVHRILLNTEQKVYSAVLDFQNNRILHLLGCKNNGRSGGVWEVTYTGMPQICLSCVCLTATSFRSGGIGQRKR